MNISNGMDIEHISPKSKNNELINEWDNLLIACKVCNRIKSDNNKNRTGYIFPDTHNTAYAYKYEKTKVSVNKSLTKDEVLLAQATIDLVDINREKDSTNRKDDRHVARFVEWDKAIDSLKDYESNSCDEMLKQIGRTPSGFISSWLTVFKDYSEVKKEILLNSSGTDYKCLDNDLNPVESLAK